MRSEPIMSRVHVHLETLAAVLVAGLGWGLDAAAGLFWALLAVALARAGVAVAIGFEPRLRVQLGSAAVDLSPLGPIRGAEAALLLTGPAAALAASGALYGLGGPWLAAALWAGFLAAPAPGTDGGALLRGLLLRRLGLRRAWVTGLGAGAACAGLAFALVPAEVVFAFVAVSVLLGRTELGALAALETYEALERDPELALSRALARSSRAGRGERAVLAELGLFAAVKVERQPAAETLLPLAPAAAPATLEAARWLMLLGSEAGARAAERAHDEVDAGRAQPEPEAYADLCFRHAVFLAEQGRGESAVGLFERAVHHGYDDRDRALAESAFAPLAEHPRFARALSRLPEL